MFPLSLRRPSPSSFSAHRYSTLAALMSAVFLAPLAETPALPPRFRAGLLVAVTTVLLLRLAWHVRQGRIAPAWKNGLSSLALGLAGWSLVPWHLGPYRDFADAEMVRVVLGVAVYFAACLLSAHQVGLAVRLLVVYGSGVALWALGQFGEAQTSNTPLVFDHTLGIFGQFENLGSFLMLLLPLGTVLAFGRMGADLTRLAWQGIWLLLVATLVLSCVRAAWVMAIISLLILWRLSPSSPSAQRARRPLGDIWKAALPLVLALAAIVVFGRAEGMLFRRSATLSRISQLTALTDRVFRTRQAFRAAAEMPVTGWGLGTWTVRQRRWTGEADDEQTVLRRHDVWSRGVDDQSTAFDYWAQWLAETGAPGLVLLAAIPLSFLLRSRRMVPSLTDPRRRAILAGCTAAVAGFLGDAFCSPAYNLPGDYVLPWLFMGLGVAVCQKAGAASTV